MSYIPPHRRVGTGGQTGLKSALGHLRFADRTQSRVNGPWRGSCPTGDLRTILIDPSAGDHNRFYVGPHRIYNGGIRAPPRTSDGQDLEVRFTRGAGTLQDPKVIWCYRPDDELWGTELESAQTAAKEAGAKCIILRTGMHNKTARRDANNPGQVATVWLNNNTPQQFIEPCDWHVTVFLGDGMDRVYLQGHLFLYDASDEDQAYELVRDPADRKYPRSQEARDKLHYEYWMMPGTQIVSKNTGLITRYRGSPPAA